MRGDFWFPKKLWVIRGLWVNRGMGYERFDCIWFVYFCVFFLMQDRRMCSGEVTHYQCREPFSRHLLNTRGDSMIEECIHEFRFQDTIPLISVVKISFEGWFESSDSK